MGCCSGTFQTRIRPNPTGWTPLMLTFHLPTNAQLNLRHLVVVMTIVIVYWPSTLPFHVVVKAQKNYHSFGIYSTETNSCFAFTIPFHAIFRDWNSCFAFTIPFHAIFRDWNISFYFLDLVHSPFLISACASSPSKKFLPHHISYYHPYFTLGNSELIHYD